MRHDATQGGSLIIFATFLLGLVLSQIPLPDFLLWYRPEWVALVLIYWVLMLPHRVGLVSAFSIGILLDIIRGSVLGLNALSLTLIAYLVLLLYKRLRMFPLWQQSMMVMVLVGVNQLLFFWMQGITGTTAGGLQFMLPSLISALLWPWVYVVLHGVRRTFRIE
ncbi:MAG: rod shape-determining protein MreD [Nitrincola lacisaponensis]|uniref:Rod shape-determining protein MreD n=1 Tax=Nitrincola lacisaponensis TaxID=267850 RepID=A0A063Y6I8_9GAMM|nr:rod shape-determining protein MreD [Nitrincola lacisaponensis]KDE40765.1 Rod shape-determining protein MreD [Nitrincola lacisaponensis]